MSPQTNICVFFYTYKQGFWGRSCIRRLNRKENTNEYGVVFSFGQFKNKKNDGLLLIMAVCILATRKKTVRPPTMKGAAGRRKGVLNLRMPNIFEM